MILTIGAVDSSGGAGLDQDRRTAEKLNCPVRSAVTGITVQGKKGVTAIHPVPANILRKQIETHLEEDNPKAIKIGALCEISQIDLIKYILQHWKRANPQTVIVADPVFKPTRGLAFLKGKAVDKYLNLISITDVITPNRLELETLSHDVVSNLIEAESAGVKLAHLLDISVVVTGGHFQGTKLEEAVITRDSIWRYTKDWVKLNQSHGSGCCLSTALTVYLAEGLHVNDAFHYATDFASKYLRK